MIGGWAYEDVESPDFAVGSIYEYKIKIGTRSPYDEDGEEEEEAFWQEREERMRVSRWGHGAVLVSRTRHTCSRFNQFVQGP